MLRDHARGYAFERVAASTRRIYQGACQLCVKWREWRGKIRCSEAIASELNEVDGLAEYKAYCCATRRNRETTVASTFEAVNHFHEKWVGRSLP